MHTRSTRLLGQRLLLGRRLVVLGVSVLLSVSPAAARNAREAPAGRCTVRNVAGAYGVVGSGTILQALSGHPAGPFATVGILTFDGQGRWSTTNQSVTENGQVTTGVSVTGIYTVHPDCTFTLEEDDTRNSDTGVFVHDRQEGFLMATVEGVIVTFTIKRIRQND